MAEIIAKITNNHILQQLLHNAVDDLVNRNQINFNKYRDVGLSDDDVQSAIMFIQNLYKERIQQAEKFDITKISNLNQEVKDCIVNCYEVRKHEILQAVIRNCLIETGKPLVENIDWKLKWIIGSSKLAHLRQPVVQLDLHCFKKEDDNVRKTVNFEMNMDQLDKLLATLQNTKLQ